MADTKKLFDTWVRKFSQSACKCGDLYYGFVSGYRVARVPLVERIAHLERELKKLKSKNE